MMKPTFYAFIAAFAFIHTVSFSQSTIILFANKDNTIYSESNNSNAVGDYLFAGNNSGKNARRALMFFQMNIPVSPIPESRLVVNEVVLRLKPNKTNTGTQVFTLHKLIADWGESTSNANSAEGTGASPQIGDATWNYAKYATVPWVKGGNFVSTPSATFSIGDLNDQNISAVGLLEDVKFWLTNPDKNFGWVLLGTEANSQTAYRFDSRENASKLGPRLEIRYTIITSLDEKIESEAMDKILYRPELSTIEYTGNEKATQIQLLDISGNIIETKEHNKISTTHLFPGIYIVRVQNESTIFQTRFYIFQ